MEKSKRCRKIQDKKKKSIAKVKQKTKDSFKSGFHNTRYFTEIPTSTRSKNKSRIGNSKTNPK